MQKREQIKPMSSNSHPYRSYPTDYIRNQEMGKSKRYRSKEQIHDAEIRRKLADLEMAKEIERDADKEIWDD